MSDACCHETCAPVRAAARASGEAARAWSVGAGAAAILAAEAARALGHPGAAIVCDAAVIGAAGWMTAVRAARALRTRLLDINVLMLVAVAGAVALGDWREGALVVWLFAVAQGIESLSLARAYRATRALLTLAPTRALVRRPDGDALVDAADVRVGDIVLVRPGERIPLDGVVTAGLSSVDQASVTGESWPVDKAAGDAVLAGSINGAGSLDVEVQRPASDSTLARMIRLVEDAQLKRAPIQTFVDRFARRYTPVVVSLAVAIAVVPPLVAGGAPAAFATWAYRALALLVVSCPCALVISTPVSIVSALTAAARAGVLIKGGEYLERLGRIRCVAFDKTGTLTHEDIAVTSVTSLNGATTRDVLGVAAALESRSEHPIGRAIVGRARGDGLVVASGEDFRALPGLGAEARVARSLAIVGSHRLFEARQLCTPALHEQIDEVTGAGNTPVLVGSNGAALGVIGLAHTAREEGRAAVAELRSHGVDRIVLLTGDAEANAVRLGEALGLDEVRANLMPAEKVASVHELRDRYGPVAMVGDGINDAPALAAADVGIAMGGAGSDVAIETADVALMSDDLTKLPYAIRLGRATMSNIKTNVAVALGLKVAFVVLAAAGVATLWMAVLADTGASLLVTANSLRLLARDR